MEGVDIFLIGKGIEWVNSLPIEEKILLFSLLLNEIEEESEK